ncbi:MAG: ABC transporter substrate-binding protein, partial [Propionibacteriaceae bacterium]|nr:ABC transporter substrate-binding protein [Propionibacteriaceae bacterium]
MRLKPSLAVAALAAALALTGCSGSPTPTEPAGSPSVAPSTEAPAQGTVALTVAKPDGPITEEMNNPWVNDASAMRLGYINALMEPLGIVNLIKPDDPIRPWLASEIAWSDDYKSVTLTARDGVTWSDGTPFTAEDIAFTFDLFLKYPQLDLASIGLDSVSAVDGNKVTLNFKNSMYVKQDKVLHKLIAPKHIWEKVADPATETNPNPVGTGPYTLSNFSSQSVELTARDDYWGGTPAVPTLYYISYADNTALTTALANGDADWAQAFIPNVQSAFLDKDPEHNVYWAAAGLGIDTMFVNTTTKPFNDLAFRKAVNMVIDREKHQTIAREGGVPLLSSITGLPTPGGDAFILPAYQGKTYSVDVEGARKVLSDAG